MRLVPFLMAAVCALGLAACGDDEKTGDTATTVTVTQPVSPPPTSTTAPQQTSECPDVSLAPNSGEGAFQVRVTNITCEEATALLKSDDGLKVYTCETDARPDGDRIRCQRDNRTIEFTSGT